MGGPRDTEMGKGIEELPSKCSLSHGVAGPERENNKVVSALGQGSKGHYGNTRGEVSGV